MTERAIRILTLSTYFFTGIGALVGGFALMSDTSGQSLGMSTEVLPTDIFSNFFIPGLFLFIVIGMGHIIIACLLIKNKTTATFNFSFLLGLILACWIIVQFILIGYLSLLQPVFGLIGFVEMTLSTLWRKFHQT